MYQTNELMFPPSVIPGLIDLRGPAWRALVEQVATLPETHPEKLAFSLMMIRLDGCLECEMDSFRAMKGCLACARQTVRRIRRTDEELLEAHREALKDLLAYLELHPSRIVPALPSRPTAARKSKTPKRGVGTQLPLPFRPAPEPGAAGLTR